jgi:cyclic-di-GMP-binding protein
MALSLSVPVSTSALPKEIETNPKKARAWIESLPLTKTVEAAKLVLQTISTLNLAKMPGEERVALAEVYRPVVAVLLDELQDIYVNSTLPLPARAREAFDLARDLRTQCAIAYKILLLEKAPKLSMFGAKKNLPGAMYWAMHYLQSQLLQCYKTYHPCTPGVWQELHSLYLHAGEQGTLAEIGDAETKSTMRDLYTDALMISLADPYRLMSREVDKVLDTLQQNRGLVDIHASNEGLNLQRHFLVALDGDLPPKVLIQGIAPPAGQILRLVDPTRLVEKIQQRIRAQSGAGSNAAAKGRATHDLADLQQRLIRLWGDPPKRQFRRNPADASIALCSSIKAIAHFTELASNEDPEADAQAIRDGDTIPLLKIPRDDISAAIGVEEWHVLNQSANGLRLYREAGGSVGVTVGEVVGMRFIGGRNWNVGVVRWLTLLEGNALEFGVELLAPGATSITIEPTIGSGSKPMPALVLQNTNPEWDDDTVLSLTDTFSDLREFELIEHDEVTVVRATTLLERTSRFDLFQFQTS